MAERLWEASTFTGLISIIDDPKTSVQKGCQAVEECISSNKDNLRGFFEQCFAPLVARIFGYSGPSWLSQVVRGGKESDVRALLKLLSPSGPLFASMYNADADGSTQFHFPRQRLPTHTQMMLETPTGIAALSTWPQYASSLTDATSAAGRGHIHVPVFQYFCYWFAFYVIKGGDVDTGGIPLGSMSSSHALGASMRRAAGALHLPGSHHRSLRDADLHALRHPYIALLRQLLLELVPRPVGGMVTSPLVAATGAAGGRGAAAVSGLMDAVASPYYRTPTAMPSSRRGSNAISRGLLFYSILVEFWLKDADEPVPLTNTAGRGGGRPPLPSLTAPLWATAYEPPSEDLLEALLELVQYATAVAPAAAARPGSASAPSTRRQSSSQQQGQRQHQPAQGNASWLPPSPVLWMPVVTSLSSSSSPGAPGAMPKNSGINPLTSRGMPPVGPPLLGAAGQLGSQSFARQMYRFFYRALSMWPDQRTMKPLLRVFLAYIAPWQPPSSSASGMATSSTLSAMPASAPGAAASSPGAAVLKSHLLSSSVTDLVHRVSRTDLVTNEGNSMTGAYSPEWETHVLSNLPFYLELLPLFLERSISRISIRGESAVQDVVKVMSVLENAQELVSILKEIEKDYGRCAVSQPRRAEGRYAELLPWLIDQAEDWQVAATANCLGDTPATKSISVYSMFATTGDRCAALIAKDVLHVAGGMLKPDAMKKLSTCLEKVLPLQELAVSPAMATSPTVVGRERHDVIPRLPRSTWKDVRYKGDSLETPLTSYEIAPLVKIAIFASKRANALLGLDHPWVEGEDIAENRLQEVFAVWRKRGMRVNLRPFVDVRSLVWLPVLWWTVAGLIHTVWWVLVLLVNAITSTGE